MTNMPGTNLTREEASERASIVSTETYDVQLDLTLDSDTRFGSITTIRFGATPGAATFVDLVDAEISSITLNGAPVDPSAYADNRIALTGLAESNELVVDATCAYSRSGEGLHRFVDPVDQRVYLYTQFEVPDARRVFATFEQPDLKAVFTFHVTAPSEWAVVSNSPTPEPVAAGEGTSTWHFEPTKRMSTYITALIAGEYVSVTDSYRGAYDEIPLGIFCRQSIVEHLDADDIFLVTKQGFEFFEGAFEMAYPFGKYDQLFVPEYNMGAMENAGAVTFRDEMIFRSRQTVAAYEQRANTILHEMAHMWFGDLVTMKWWDDLWLNESFAEFAASHSATNATRFTDSWTSFTNARKNWAYRQDQLPSTHPIAADNYDLHAVEANFDGITYAKGASALKQLVAWVGEKDFFAGLRAYFGKHAYGNTELKDLLAELEEASGRELGAWAEEWLQTSGVNTLRAWFETDDEGYFTSFSVEQTAIEAYPTLRRHRIAIGLYDQVEGKLVRTRARRDRHPRRVDADRRAARHQAARPDPAQRRRPDVRQDPARRALVRDADREHRDVRGLAPPRPVLGIGVGHDPRRRAVVVGLRHAGARRRRLGDRPDGGRLAAAPGLERDQPVTRPDAARPELKERWESGVRALMESAEPGSDHQLAFVRAYASAASGPDRLREILDGGLDGLYGRHRPAVDDRHGAGSASVRPTRPRSPPSSSATTRSPARRTPPRPARSARRPRRRPRRGRSPRSTRRRPTRPVARPRWRSRSPGRPRSSSRTSTATSRWPTRSSTRWACGSGRSR